MKPSSLDIATRTLRWDFAMRASHEIPEWFQPAKLIQRPLEPLPLTLPVDTFPDDFPDGVSKRNYILNLASGWRRDPTFSLADYVPMREDLRTLVDLARPLLTAYEAAVETYFDDVEEWKHDFAVQRIAEWPWYWADLVMGAEDGGDGR